MGKRRRHLRRLHQVRSPARPPVFFLTCCVRERSPVLASATGVQVLVDSWRRASDIFGWTVGRYVVMPDHVHFFASPCAEEAKSLSVFVGSWKSWTRKEIRRMVQPSFEWQREFFDHLLRSSESYGEKWDYVRMNPVRAGLVTSPEDWPYQGEVGRLE